jgi:hypothetical protein
MRGQFANLQKQNLDINGIQSQIICFPRKASINNFYGRGTLASASFGPGGDSSLVVSNLIALILAYLDPIRQPAKTFSVVQEKH